MKEIKVTTQAEYDKHKDDKNVKIVIESGSVTIGDSARVDAYGSARVDAYDSASVYAHDSARVDAHGSASVYAHGSARVDARGSARVYAYDSARVYAYGSASVDARDSARVDAYGSASVYAYGSASVDARGSASVDARGSASVYARGSARVYARDSARVDAYGSARVYARGSASVYAYDSASVDARGSASVYARDSARVDAYDSASVYAHGWGNVDATAYVAVIEMPICRSRIKGGHVIKIPDFGAETATIEMWVDFYGTTVTDRKILVFKGVSPKLVSDHGTEYPIGGEASAADWQPTRECGKGLHFSPTPRHTRNYHSFGDDARYLACEVDVDQAVIIDDKIKAPSCRVLYEVDLHGNKIETKEEVTA